MTRNPDTLHGIKEIGRYVNRSYNTVLDWIQKYGMPAKKISGEWVSSKKAIDRWFRKVLNA